MLQSVHEDETWDALRQSMMVHMLALMCARVRAARAWAPACEVWRAAGSGRRIEVVRARARASEKVRMVVRLVCE